MRALLCLLPIVGSCALAQSKISGEFLFNGTKAYALGPAELASRSWVRKSTWSPDGKNILIERLNAPFDLALLQAFATEQPSAVNGTVELQSYAVDSGKSVTLCAVPTSLAPSLLSGWVPGTRRALFVLAGTGTANQGWAVSLFDAANGRTKVLLQGDGEVPTMLISPIRGEAILSRFQEGRMVGRGVFADGTISSEFELPSASLLFDGDGVALVHESGGRNPAYRMLNLRTGSVGERRERLTPTLPVAQPWQVRAAPVRVSSSMGEGSMSGALLILNSASSAMVLTSDGTNPQIAPTQKAVSYTHHGSLMVRAMLEVPRAAIEEAMMAAKRKSAMDNSKQAALASLMFAMDHDETLPSAEGIQDKLYPYLRNRKVADQFVYTYTGGPISQIAKPAETEIGYTAGPGGRAVAYADGHVRWVPDN